MAAPPLIVLCGQVAEELRPSTQVALHNPMVQESWHDLSHGAAQRAPTNPALPRRPAPLQPPPAPPPRQAPSGQSVADPPPPSVASVGSPDLSQGPPHVHAEVASILSAPRVMEWTPPGTGTGAKMPADQAQSDNMEADAWGTNISVATVQLQPTPMQEECEQAHQRPLTGQEV